MGFENLGVFPEVWPVAADRLGVWLLTGAAQLDASLPVSADGDIDADAKAIYTGAGFAMEDLLLFHSTSWRQVPGRPWQEGVPGRAPGLVATYVAVVETGTDYVRSRWPHAAPVSPLLLPAVGRPYQHGATEAPQVRDVEVLLHAIRHLEFLRQRDATAAAVLNGRRHWKAALDGLEPALAGMYRHDLPEAA